MKLMLTRLAMLLGDAKKLTLKHGLTAAEKESIISDIENLMEKIKNYIYEGK